jgi:hypothetical protein
MDLEGFHDESGCACAECMHEEDLDRTCILEAMNLAHHAGYPIGTTGRTYIQMIATQADVDLRYADEVITEALLMAAPGNKLRNSNPKYH